MQSALSVSNCFAPVQRPLCLWRQGTTTTPCATSTSYAVQQPSCLRASSVSLGPQSRPQGRRSVRVFAGPGAPVEVKWWTKNNPPNMVSVKSVQEFIDQLADARDKAVLVEFYGKWCHSCRSLFPKVCSLAASNPNVLVVKVDWDDNKEICKALNIKVLPYFQIYRGRHGKVAEFSASLPKVQKLKDALERYTQPCNDCGDGVYLKEFPGVHPRSQVSSNVVTHRPTVFVPRIPQQLAERERELQHA